MSRFPTQSQAPREPTFEEDEGFLGVNMKLAERDRSKLAPGVAAYAENYRFRDGSAVKRNGSIKPLFANTAAYGSIVGGAVYSNPRGEPQLLIAATAQVWAMTDNGTPTAIAIPEGETLAEPCHFVQVFDKVLLLRGENARRLQWNGLASGSFEFVSKRDPADTSTIEVPNTERGIAFRDRFVFPLERTRIGVSDTGDYSSYDRAFANILLNLGTSDRITRLYPFVKSALVVGKENRTEIFAGLDTATATLDPLNDTIGSCAWDSWAMIGGDATFLSRPGGIYRITEIVQDRLQTAPQPISDPIEPLIRRINWSAASRAFAVVHGIYHYMAVPLDGATRNNVLLVYNTVTGQCEGFDSFDSRVAMQIDELLIFPYLGTPRLWAVNHGTGTVHLLEEGKTDEGPGGASYEVRSRLETRGYATRGAVGAARRDTKRFDLFLGTWNPLVQLGLLTEGSENARPLLTYTRDGRKWNTAGKAMFNPATDDRSAEGREDYSVDVTELDGDGLDFGDDGIEFERRQYETVPLSLAVQSRYASLRIESVQGDCDVCAVSEESSAVERGATRRAV